MPLTSGQLDEIAPGVRRLVARNPGFMTGPGTNTYLVGAQRCVVIDPGPDDPVHVERILEASRRPHRRGPRDAHASGSFARGGGARAGDRGGSARARRAGAWPPGRDVRADARSRTTATS